ncbi:MAG: 7TM domain-containing protein [Candidatus Woesebacteria bacterium]|jgi:hypothetical protein
MLKKYLASFFLAFLVTIFSFSFVFAQTPTEVDEEGEATQSAQVAETPTVTPQPRTDLTQESEETLGPLEKILEEQNPGVKLLNPVKHAIRSAVSVGVPANTIVLLLVLPLVASIIAATRHLIGIRGFGIFLPAALSVVFVATGPVLGIVLFLVIVAASTVARLILRKSKVRLQYLPRMALLLWFVVVGVLAVLFSAPIIKRPDLTTVSIFPVLILALLAEDFSRVQIGKSARVAVNITTETLVLALISYIFLTLEVIQKFALLNPEVLLVGVFVFNVIVGKYVGLRLVEIWRFKKLITG